MNRQVAIDTNNVEICSIDERSQGMAFHKYVIRHFEESCNGASNSAFAEVNFQKGPIKETGINGCNNEDLIAIVIDRLQCFQEGDFKCRENAIAITKLEEALMWLNKRTQDRAKRGVEGTNKV